MNQLTRLFFPYVIALFLFIGSPLVLAGETFEIQDHEVLRTKLGLTLEILRTDFSIDNPGSDASRSAPSVGRTTIKVRLKYKGQTHDDFFIMGDIGTITRDQIEWENFRIALLDRKLQNKNWLTIFRVEKLGR